MEQEDIVQRVKIIMGQELEIPTQGVELDTSLLTLNIDSLDMLKLAVALEKEFDIEITTEEITQITTFGDIVYGLKKRLAKDR